MDALLFRFFERLIVVLFSGMAIYLGFRLFLAVPEQRNASGEIKLPKDISIILSRIGPGAFFALFGTLVLGLALLRPLAVNSLESGNPSSYSYASPAPTKDASAAHADARAVLRKEIAVLNTIPGELMVDLPEADKESIVRALRRVKLKLMQPVWGTSKEGFGNFSDFERWVQEGESDPPPEGMQGALTLYRYPAR